MVTDRNQVIVALQAECDRKSEELRIDNLKALPRIADSMANEILGLAQSMEGVDIGSFEEAGIEFRIENEFSEIETPFVFSEDENGEIGMEGKAKIRSGFDQVMSWARGKGGTRGPSSGLSRENA
jgi:hypothetical protein